MRIMIIANNDVGLYKFRKELIETLLEKHEVSIVLPYGDFVDEFLEMGCDFYPVFLKRRGINPLEDFKLFIDYVGLIKKIKPNIVLTYTIKPNIYGGFACRVLKIPYVANITGLGTAVENSGILQLITKRLYKIALKNAQKVFFQNYENRVFMLQNKIVSCDNDLLPGSGVNLDYYSVLEYPPEDTVEFVFVSRIMKEKGANQFLEAAKEIRKKYPQTRFHICGACEPEYDGELQKLVDNNTVIYHGFVKDIAVILKVTHCMVHPTYYPEGMSNVLLEACASGRPIITTDRAGCKEIVDDGINGFVVKQQDSRDLIEKIEKFLSLSWEERRDMGLAGRKKVENGFDRRIVVNKYMKEIENYGRL